MIWFLIYACGGGQEPAEKPVNPPQTRQQTKPQRHMSGPGHQPGKRTMHGPNRPNKKQRAGMPGSTSAEDLRSSWKDGLAAAVGKEANPKNCPDKDKDGFYSAVDCPWGKTVELDCDDNDPSIGPAQERWVPPGPFLMGSESSHAGADEKPVHVVELSGYCLDTKEVSTGDWSRWLKKTGKKPQGKDVRGIDENGNVKQGRESYPAEGVTWKEADAYCKDIGKRLPTEAQWEKAARGGCELGTNPEKCDPADLRAYPWGSKAPDCKLANHQQTSGGMPRLCVSDTVKTESMGAGSGPYGHLHLSGNIWEYVQDTWHPNVYTAEKRTDPGGPAGGDIHVLRGGGWNTFSTNMRAANRFGDLVMGSATGFRCARPTVKAKTDRVEAVSLVPVSGTVKSGQLENLTGRAIYVTAFDARDADSNGMLVPGRSPVAEIKLTPNGQKEQKFNLPVPKNGKYILSAALDAGSGGQKENYVSASGSGGFGHADQNPVNVQTTKAGITIELKKPPSSPHLHKK